MFDIPAVIPTKIEPFNETEILIAWNNGESFRLPYTELRFYCPCAACVDEHTGQRTIQRTSVRSDVRPRGIDLVGRYAIQLRWSDGHVTGIYSYEWLREVCETSGQKA